MTTEEAKTKWCPFSRAFTKYTETSPYNVSTSIGNCNRTVEGQPVKGSFCLANRCMAWVPTPAESRGTPSTNTGVCGMIHP